MKSLIQNNFYFLGLLSFLVNFAHASDYNEYKYFLPYKKDPNIEGLKIKFNSNNSLEKNYIRDKLIDNKINLTIIKKERIKRKIKINEDQIKLIGIFPSKNNFKIDYYKNKNIQLKQDLVLRNKKIKELEEFRIFIDRLSNKRFNKIAILLKFDSSKDKKLLLPKYAFFCLDMNNKENEEVVNKLNSINELFEKGEYPSKNPYLIKYNKDLCSIFENKLLL